MSEDNNDFKLIRNKPRSKKLHPKIDLAAMVSVSFLLIIFFMVTNELSKPQAMDLGLPSCGDESDSGTIYCGPRFERTLTLLLDDDNKVISYFGLLDYPNEKPKKLNFGKDGIRKELISKNKTIKEDSDFSNRGLIVIIKPSKKCNYGNLVDILDEMAITKIETYAIINDYTPEEVKLLASK
ncbi:biopolymer transporter ExbD [Flavobacterium buctense]|uniref:Biopolymer transporter ExbD n=1 Tax=Flavobacterium buctense TaxID=1648146 RepID=A0ABU9DZF1_9FLAO|nr:biopolymer transporter ExbD [Flavobacterium buctense]